MKYSLYDPIIIAAFIISISSAIFVAIKEGVGLTLEYRESETTSRRKKEIDDTLRKEVKKKLDKFLKEDRSTKADDEEVLEKIEDLGRCAFLARFTTERMLDNMTSYMKVAFKNLAVFLFALFFTLFYYFTMLEGTVIRYDIFLMFCFLVIMTGVFFALVITNLKKHYFIREEFVRLSENPNLDYCDELYDELYGRGLW